MIEYILGTFLITTIYLFFFCYWLPKRKLHSYANRIRKAGYRVLQQPFIPFNSSYSLQFQQATKTHGDAYHNIKHKYSKVDVVVTNVANKVLLILIKPQFLQALFSPDNMKLYPKSSMTVDGIKYLLGEGIGFSEGEEWRRKRKAISKLFNYDLIISNIPKICEIVDKNLDKMEEQSKTGDHEYAYNILEFSTSSFLHIMMRCFFGGEPINEKIKGQSFEMFINNLIGEANLVSVSPMVLFLGKYAFKLGVTPSIRRVAEGIDIFRAIAKKFVEKRVEQISKSDKIQCSDIISSLVLSQRNNKGIDDDVKGYSYDQAFTQFCSNLIAGTDTSAHLFLMIVHYMCRNPDKGKKLREEIEGVIKSEKDITFENIKKLKYLSHFQMEVTRIHGPGNGVLLRTAAKDHQMCKMPVPEGTMFTIMSSGNHYSEQFFKDPFEFRPERWESECDNLNQYAYVGFGGGPRACLGKHLAILQIKITLIKMILRYQSIKLPKEKYQMIQRFLYEPEPMKAMFVKRKKSDQ